MQQYVANDGQFPSISIEILYGKSCIGITKIDYKIGDDRSNRKVSLRIQWASLKT